MTDSLFAANYELKHIADKDAMFKEPKFTDEEMLLYDGVCHIASELLKLRTIYKTCRITVVTANIWHSGNCIVFMPRGAGVDESPAPVFYVLKLHILDFRAFSLCSAYSVLKIDDIICHYYVSMFTCY